MLHHLKPLALLAKTVECGSFRGAAQFFGLSPSVVSQQIGDLEQHLGCRLLHRSTRRLALTDEGRVLCQAAQAMLNSAEQGLDELAGRAANPAGLLRVAAPALLMATDFPKVIGDFARQFPKVRLELGFSEERVDLLRDGWDVALRIGWLEDSSLRQRRLGAMARVLVATPAYLAGRSSPVVPTDLRDWDWLHLAPVAPHALLRRGDEPSVQIDFAPRLSVNSAIALHGMAVASLGLAMVPEVLARSDLAAGRLVEILPAWRLQTAGVFAIWPAGSGRPGLSLRFIDFLHPRIEALFGPADASGP